MWPSRLRGYLDALGVLVCEVAGLVLLLRAAPVLGTVDFSDFGHWLQTSSPQGALTALTRLLGIAVFGWLLGSTLLYGAAVLSGRKAMITKSRRLTLPVLRRIVDSLAAASVAASTLGNLAGVSGATQPPRPAPVIQPLAPKPAPDSVTRPAVANSSPAGRASAARVSSTAIGRHFPHPGPGSHPVPGRSGRGEGIAEVPGEANGFAGLPRGTKVVVVQPGDCLSVLAERHLGDWRLDTEIEALNWGRLQPDGRALVDDHWIYVGWVLVMPPDAVGTLVVGEGTLRPPDPAQSGHVARAAVGGRTPAEHDTATAPSVVESLRVAHPAETAARAPDRSLGSTLRPQPTAAPTIAAPGRAGSTSDRPTSSPDRAGESAPPAAGGVTLPGARAADGADGQRALTSNPVPGAQGVPDPGSRAPAPPGSDDGHRAVPRVAGPRPVLGREGGRGETISSGDRYTFGDNGVLVHGFDHGATTPDSNGVDIVAADDRGSGPLHGTSNSENTSPAVSAARGPAPVPVGVLADGDPGVSAAGRNVLELAAAAGIGAVAGAGIVWRLDRSRREQNHRRPKGRLIARNKPEVEGAERRVRAIASEEAMRWVDSGTRYLSGLTEQLSVDNQGPVPSLALVRVGAGGLAVVVSRPVSGSLGWFSPTGDGTALVLDPDITLQDLEALGADRWTLWPALLSLGASDGDVLMLNMEHAGSLSVEGSPDLVRGVLAQLVLELSSQPWSDEMLSAVYALGDCPLDDRLPSLHRVPVGEVEELVEKLSQISISHQQLAGPFPLANLRVLACEALPNIVVAFAGSAPDALEHLALAAVPDQSGIAVAGAGPFPGTRWRLTLSNGGGGVLQGELAERPVSFELAVNCIPEQVALLGEALGAASDPFAATGGADPWSFRTVPTGPASGESVPGDPAPGDSVSGGRALGDSASIESPPVGPAPGEPAPGRSARGGSKADESPPVGPVPGESAPGGSALGDSTAGESTPVGPAPGHTVDVRDNGSHFQPAHQIADDNEVHLQPVYARRATLPERGDVEICVLGPVDIAGGQLNALEPSRRMAVMSLLAYMASHRRPLRADEVSSALWPLDAGKEGMGGPQRKTVMNLISRARGVLGYGAGGTERLGYSAQGYRLAEEVTLDWARFEGHVALARRQRPAEATVTLRAALDLVTGEPFGGVLSSQFFEWVASEHLDLTITAKVVDAAQDLGQYALDAGDFETVIWAVETGLQLEPTREELSRLWMHALGRTGRPAQVDDVYRRLKVVLRHRLSALHEPQPETREVWRRYTRADATRTGELEAHR
jgi:DNA-binding SARP family transcriptional activator